MKFYVYGLIWGSGAPKPEDILNQYVKAVPIKIPSTGQIAPHLEVEITTDELMAMVAAQEFDILISGDLLAFDGKFKRFRQR